MASTTLMLFERRIVQSDKYQRIEGCRGIRGLICFYYSGQPQGIAPTSEYFLDIKNIVVGAILYGCLESRH